MHNNEYLSRSWKSKCWKSVQVNVHHLHDGMLAVHEHVVLARHMHDAFLAQLVLRHAWVQAKVLAVHIPVNGTKAKLGE